MVLGCRLELRLRVFLLNCDLSPEESVRQALVRRPGSGMCEEWGGRLDLGGHTQHFLRMKGQSDPTWGHSHNLAPPLGLVEPN